MKVETGEWIDKADGDFATASRENDVKDNPNFDAVCFHSQQAAEKFLKARLVEGGISFPRTHDLESLLTSALPVNRPGSVFGRSFGHSQAWALKCAIRE